MASNLSQQQLPLSEKRLAACYEDCFPARIPNMVLKFGRKIDKDTKTEVINYY
jgi:hypothetical protein